MGKNTVDSIIKDGLCTVCGICAGSCPEGCIYTDMENGITVIKLNKKMCINCGICKKVCPNNYFDYKIRLSNNTDFWIGPYTKLLKVQLKDKILLQQSSSGGVVTGLIRELLNNGEYSCTFLVNTYKHDIVTKSEKFIKGDSLLNTTKSRYVTVSHEKAIAYILKNREEKVILVGTSCFVHGLYNIIEKFNLNRDNYFIIGLFCDKTMNNNVYSYFKQHPVSQNQLDYIHFRNKDVGGWPGGIRIFLKDGSHKDISRTERIKVKEYFQLEGCLYCLDKLNILADISVGDNYISENNDKDGISSVIIRTQKAIEIWGKYNYLFVFDKEEKEKFLKSQNIEKRQKNLAYSLLKPIKYKLPSDITVPKINNAIKDEYKEKLRKICIGSKNISYYKIQADTYIKSNKHKKTVKENIKFIYKTIYISIKYNTFEYIKAIFNIKK